VSSRTAPRFGTLDRTVRWNFVANIMDGALFAFAMSFVSQQTVLPVFVRAIGGGNIAIGLIPVLWTFGFNFPQILIAGHAQRQRRKKPLLLKTALGQRIPWLLLAFATYFLFGSVGTTAALVMFFLLYTMAAVAGSINLPVWFDLIARLTPVHVRGRLFGGRSIVGGLLGILGGGVVTYVLSILPSAAGYAVLLSLTFLVMMVSYLFLMSLREDNGTLTNPDERNALRFRDLPHVLRSRPNYRNYLIADALLICSMMGAAFFTIQAFDRFALTDAYAGAFTMIMMASSIVASLVFGMLADRYGHKVNLLVSALTMTAACLAAMLAPSVGLYALVFVASSVSTSLLLISRLPFIAELSPDHERPTMVATVNMITAPFVLSGIAAGWMANIFGYTIVFVLAALFAAAAFVWLLTMVDEPRQKRMHDLAVVTERVQV